jgi:hypothetical protein
VQTFPWKPTHSLTDETASLLIAAQFPSLSPVRVKARHEGWDNEAVELNGKLVFRFPKCADGEVPPKRELVVLPRLSTALPVPVPAYQMIGKPGPFFPYVFPGYRKLNGTPAIDLSVNLVDAIALAPLLGSFLSAVHSFSPAEAQDLWVFMGLAGRAARDGSDSALSGSHGSRISRSRPSLWCLFSDCECVLRSDGGNRQKQTDRSRGARGVVLASIVSLFIGGHVPDCSLTTPPDPPFTTAILSP